MKYDKIDPASRTYENLKAALKGEAEASVRYLSNAQKARSEGLDTVAETFEKLAKNEQRHAMFWLGMLAPDAPTPARLRAAIEGEHKEWTEMYLNFALQAKDEGFDQAAELFQRVSEIERGHEKRFRALLALLDEETAPGEIAGEWFCAECGHVAVCAERPGDCPACGAAGSFESNR